MAVQREWVGRVIDGRFTLVEWLGGSETSGVFLTELDGTGSPRAVIRLIAAEDEGTAEHSELSHPHLATILYAARAEMDGNELDYVVSEYAEEVLSQILPQRALTAEETHEMLVPVLDALAFVHQKGLVHGHLKPSNVLVVNEQLKLSADQILARDHYRFEPGPPEIYDAPELAAGAISPASDVWSLGVLLVESLTGQPPAWNRAQGGNPEVPESVPPPFGEIARRCLQVDPSQRCTLAEVRDLLEGRPAPVAQDKPVADAAAVSEAVAHVESRPPARQEPAHLKRRVVPLVVAFLGLAAIILFIEARSHSRQANDITKQTEPAPQAAPPAAANSGAQGQAVRGSVARRVMPDVTAQARETIRGTVKVAVRVTADPTGQVTNTAFEAAGPSRYFARVAEEAARSWKFHPARVGGQAVPSVWIVRFEFRRDGDEAAADEKAP